MSFRMFNEMASVNSSTTALYLAILLVACPRQMPLEANNSPYELWRAQAEEARWRVLRLAPSTYPMKKEDVDIYEPDETNVSQVYT